MNTETVDIFQIAALWAGEALTVADMHPKTSTYPMNPAMAGNRTQGARSCRLCLLGPHTSFTLAFRHTGRLVVNTGAKLSLNLANAK